jgi:ribonuclease P/MRP protein subunit POP3
VTPSKGKRSKKRKRREAKLAGEDAAPRLTETPAPPEISSVVMIGLNNIVRSLQSLSQLSKPPALSKDLESHKDDSGKLSTSSGSPAKRASKSKVVDPDPKKDDPGETSKSPNSPTLVTSEKSLVDNSMDDSGRVPSSRSPAGTTKSNPSPIPPHFSAIFVPASSPPSIIHAHLPILIFTASFAHPNLPPTRLVTLPKGSEARLCEALGLPRVSFIGILEDAPYSTGLVDLVRESVPAIEIPWLSEIKREEYLGVKINAIETFVGAGKKEKEKVV